MKKILKKIKSEYKFLSFASQKGMSAILVVVIIGAASIVMAKGVAFLSFGGLDMSQMVNSGNSAYYNAESCLNEALYRLKKDSSYEVLEKEMSLDDGSCFMTINRQISEITITTVGLKDNFRKEIVTKASVLGDKVFLDSLQLLE